MLARHHKIRDEPKEIQDAHVRVMHLINALYECSVSVTFLGRNIERKDESKTKKKRY